MNSDLQMGLMLLVAVLAVVDDDDDDDDDDDVAGAGVDKDSIVNEIFRRKGLCRQQRGKEGVRRRWIATSRAENLGSSRIEIGE